MNQALFFKKFEILPDSPNGVQKLRELILQLAVMGKLVPQDPSDEPMSIFDNKTDEKNEQLAVNGKKRKLQKISKEETPYKLPDTWKWLRLSDISHDWGQKKPDVKFTYIDVTSINKELGLISEDLKVLNPEDAPSRARKVVKKGTVIYSTVRPYLLNIAIVDTDYDPEPIVSTAFAILHPYSGILNKYLYYYLRSKPFISYVESEMTGMAYPAINDTKLYKGLIPLPPLAEQKRIVSKVDELMILCDKLEARCQKKQELQSELNIVALDRILRAENQKEFEQNWQLICENFDLLYDNPENVEELKKVILQLAIQGKLVPQNPEDEPASVLIEKIKTEKENVLKGKKTKKLEYITQLDNEEIPYEPPIGWKWCYLDNISLKITDGEHSTPERTSSGYYLLSARNVLNGEISLKDVDYVPEREFLRLRKRCDPNKNDILISCSGSVGRVAVVDKDEAYVMVRSAALVKPYLRYVNSKYLAYTLRSPLVQNQIVEESRSTAQSNLFLGKIKKLKIILPPLAEQKRIVEKVDALMNLCNQLEEKIGDSQKNAETLTDAILIEAVRGFK
ncbi:MAG TPA: restriction endonuclease subunit S [Methanosarcina sp.]|jgi:type I restriction enzyme S subunit|nr:restriction endonuclease subunit S [Methanosarcina sp.]